PEPFHTLDLHVLEIDDDERIVGGAVFDIDDMDAAFAELDARYVGGEAAAHAHTWSVIAQAYAAINRRELPEFKPDWLNIDHRRGTAFAAGEMTAYTEALWDQVPDLRVYIEAVHRLSDVGAVVGQAANGTSQQGFEAEWREIGLVTVDSDRINRIELFDEADLDAALARFEQLSRPAPRLANAASQAYDRLNSYFARDWDAMAKLMADDFSIDDRRRVVGEAVPRDRDGQMANMRAGVDLGFTTLTSTAIATRGRRLLLARARCSTDDQGPELAFVEVLCVVDINDVNQIAAIVVFDPDDLDAAFEELDTRYVAGEAATYSQTWSAIAGVYTSFNRHELPATTPDWVTVDHRPLATFEYRDPAAFFQATWNLTPQTSIYIQTVHRLNSFGAVVTHAVYGTSQEGFDAEWQQISIVTVKGGLVNRCEIYDESELDAALARFDQLSRPAPRFENVASQVIDRFRACFVSRDWDALSEILADGVSTDDRRRVVNGGLRQGRDAVIAEISALAEVGTKTIASDIVAVRGERLVLTRTRSSGRDERPEAFHTEVLNIVEIDPDERITATVNFDVDDIDAAFEELDARYIAGEAAAYARTWSVIARECAAFNRHELPAADWVTVDHRRLAVIDATEGQAAMGAIWEVTPNLRMHIEAVHRLTRLGAVATYAASGTSQEGLDAEWPMILLLTVEGDRINRCEVFDEADRDTALARFDELDRPPLALP
ncbi:MAG TPA: hypothetical protein VFA16_16435, partial [Mycobacterium sp.]|nr:hypothetical protein [Mycobacterium sp.]